MSFSDCFDTIVTGVPHRRPVLCTKPLRAVARRGLVGFNCNTLRNRPGDVFDGIHDDVRRRPKNTVGRCTHVPDIVDQKVAYHCAIGHRFYFERDTQPAQCGHINRKRYVPAGRIRRETQRDSCHHDTIELHRRDIITTHGLFGRDPGMQAQVRCCCGDGQGRLQNRRFAIATTQPGKVCPMTRQILPIGRTNDVQI